MVDVNTVVGDPVETQDGQVIVPVSRVTFGFASGGAEYGGMAGNQGGQDAQDGQDGQSTSQGFPFGGGSGAGVSVQPVGFLVVGHNSVRLLPVDGQSAIVDRLIDLAPQVIDKMQVMLGGRKVQGQGIDGALEKVASEVTGRNGGGHRS